MCAASVQIVYSHTERVTLYGPVRVVCIILFSWGLRSCDNVVSGERVWRIERFFKPQRTSGGLHLDFGALQWFKLVDIRKTQNEKIKQQLTFALHLRTATAPHKQPQPTRLSHTLLTRCVRVSCPPGRNHRQLETTLVFFRELEVLSKQHLKVENPAEGLVFGAEA